MESAALSDDAATTASSANTLKDQKKIPLPPCELQIMIADFTFLHHDGPSKLTGVSSSIPRYVIPGDCHSWRREYATIPAICRPESPFHAVAMSRFLETRRDQFTMHLDNFDAHSLEHALRIMDDCLAQSGDKLRKVEMYFWDCGRHMTVANLVKWSLFYRRFSKHLSSEVHFSGPFCSSYHGYVDHEIGLLRSIARDSLEDLSTSDMVKRLAQYIFDFVAHVGNATETDYDRYGDLRRCAQSQDPESEIWLQWSQLDPGMNDNWQKAWGRHCLLRRMPGPWDILPSRDCTSYYRIHRSEEIAPPSNGWDDSSSWN
ncbi:hypothetical protein BDZ85DRAFT_306609 [Elsinoe ampelina]|uniref:Uncharacterized protein n=1 Tax=Elsinoe ampelina TaxID=302913 RepID=A0A6A6G0F4_9PEZI|nr:hypothetical protein BDZ85DRAFT_306609 [Elsinoe ampelina]